ncbi:hypothetical protein [uncultured Helicobacter sp.]|uniref:hypothetical protein n=1 Tax=Helicobacter sp. TaxID=218 RepID=UPI002A7D9494|nr:hypothetical protein [Helicobacter sp.]MCI6312581.1 hypothetical protein [Helicobacter sp.]MCI7710453.1 hypothetical protein [Helicobacter sp.]MDD7346745.1 hypothetical protein [Helicobacter sp.]MDY2823011.1 hypothetical protein [Helicobacter sp.]
MQEVSQSLAQTPMIIESFRQLTFYHSFFSLFLILPFVLNLWSLFFYKNLVQLNKRIWFMMPLIFFLLSVAVLSGLNILVFNPQSFGISTIVMIILCLVVFGGEIYRIKILKIARRTSLEAMQRYVVFCKMLYTIDVILYALVILSVGIF